MLQGTPNRDILVLYTVNRVQKTLLTLGSALASGFKTSFTVLHVFAKATLGSTSQGSSYIPDDSTNNVCANKPH